MTFRFAPLLSLLASLAMIVPAAAQELPNGFTTGPLIEGQGPNAEVAGMTPLPKRARFKVAFDASTPAEEGAANKTLVAAARFLNMHVRNKVEPDRMTLAVVVHGKATLDLTRSAADGPNGALVAALIENGVRVIVCGQSARAQSVAHDDLLPGVELALSAMTAHALLQQDGYTLNPF